MLGETVRQTGGQMDLVLKGSGLHCFVLFSECNDLYQSESRKQTAPGEGWFTEGRNATTWGRKQQGDKSGHRDP